MSTYSYLHKCPGLPADWLNAWLAAVGATVLVPGLRLSWTTDVLPVAVLEYADENPTDALVKSWPTDERLTRDMPLADIPHKFTVNDFTKTVKKFRQHKDAWTLTSSMTDLAVSQKGEVEHGQFDRGVPKGLGLHSRLMNVYNKVSDPDMQIEASLNGKPCLEAVNGLNFNIARIGEGKKLVDTVIETLGFFGLALFPVRGDGVKTKYQQPRQRGWYIGGMSEFVWPAWSQSLDQAGIDALLDTWHSKLTLATTNKKGKRILKPIDKDWKLLGVHAAWHTTQYQYDGSDTTRGYGSKRLNP